MKTLYAVVMHAIVLFFCLLFSPGDLSAAVKGLTGTPDELRRFEMLEISKCIEARQMAEKMLLREPDSYAALYAMGRVSTTMDQDPHQCDHEGKDQAACDQTDYLLLRCVAGAHVLHRMQECSHFATMDHHNDQCDQGHTKGDQIVPFDFHGCAYLASVSWFTFWSLLLLVLLWDLISGGIGPEINGKHLLTRCSAWPNVRINTPAP